MQQFISYYSFHAKFSSLNIFLFVFAERKAQSQDSRHATCLLVIDITRANQLNSYINGSNIFNAQTLNFLSKKSVLKGNSRPPTHPPWRKIEEVIKSILFIELVSFLPFTWFCFFSHFTTHLTNRVMYPFLLPSARKIGSKSANASSNCVL